jgi:hypothetical protein
VAKKLDADFLSDLESLAARELQRRSIGKPRSRKLRDAHEPSALTKLLSVEHRLVLPRRRRTLWSDVLIARTRDAQIDAVTQIVTESEVGQDLSHYLGRGVGHAEPDTQFNDLAITHFHLGGRQPGETFSKSSSELLFVMVTVDVLYLVGIGDHTSFDDPALFETVHRNWPELLAGERVPNVVPGSYSLTAERAARLRRAGFTTLIPASDGTIYFPPGLGKTFSGVSMRVGRFADRLMTRVREFQLLCEAGLDRIVTAAAQFGVFVTCPVSLRLCGMGAVLIAEDAERRFWVSLDEQGRLQISATRLR